MARTKNVTTPPAAMPEILPARKAGIEQAQAEHALAVQQVDARIAALARELRYEGSLEPAALENGARDAIRRINLALFELGGYLLLLRERCGHGDFLARLASLDLEPRVAQQYMQVTRRFSNANSNSHLESFGKTKLLEMLVLDDEQLDDLVEKGQTGELALDDVARMSVKQLREAVRKERAVAQRLKDVNGELNTELALKKNLKVAATDWPARFKGLMDQAELSHRSMRQSIDALEAVRMTAMEDDPRGEEEQASLERARAALADRMVTIQRDCAECLDALAGIFDKTLGAFARESVR